MTNDRHGISVGVERIDHEYVLMFKATGHLTHQDYLALTPKLESALKTVGSENIKMVADIKELNGWDVRAAWDDLKLGIKLRTNLGKVAIYGDKGWQELASKVGSLFIAGEVKQFTEYDDAIDWVTAAT
ncbi:STAS/SEC14 domain-containing protein [Vibrio fortis]|jgi:hypothetical protein|uniref:STAS/SEC14 domain-containing protein n=1 Tax=Vibrio fortis TaxID=212667 RepID=UPI003EBB85AD